MNGLSDILKSIYGDGGRMPGHHAGLDSPTTTLSEKKKSITISKLNPDSMENIFEQNSKTFIDHEGPKVVETTTVYIGGCGHLLGLEGQNAPAGVCSLCSELLCNQCASNRCAGCDSIVCFKCASIIDDEIFCNKCKSSYLKKKYLFSIKSFLHGLLSKEF